MYKQPASKSQTLPPQELNYYLEEISKVTDRDAFNGLMKKFDDSYLQRYQNGNPQNQGTFPFGAASNPYNLNNQGISNPYTMSSAYAEIPRPSSLTKGGDVQYSAQPKEGLPRRNVDFQDGIYNQPMYARGGYYPEPLENTRGRERVLLNVQQPYDQINYQNQGLYHSQSYGGLPQGYPVQPQGYPAPPQGYSAQPQGYPIQPQVFIPPSQGYPPNLSHFNSQSYGNYQYNQEAQLPQRAPSPLHQSKDRYTPDISKSMANMSMKNPIQESIDLRKMKEDALNKYYQLPSSPDFKSTDKGLSSKLPVSRYPDTNPDGGNYQSFKGETYKFSYPTSDSKPQDKPSYMSIGGYNPLSTTLGDQKPYSYQSDSNKPQSYFK